MISKIVLFLAISCAAVSAAPINETYGRDYVDDSIKSYIEDAVDAYIVTYGSENREEVKRKLQDKLDTPVYNEAVARLAATQQKLYDDEEKVIEFSETSNALEDEAFKVAIKLEQLMSQAIELLSSNSTEKADAKEFKESVDRLTDMVNERLPNEDQ